MSNQRHQILGIAALLALGACEQAETPKQVELVEKAVTITIAADGKIALNGEVIAKANLENRLDEIKNAGAMIYLSPDRDASFASLKYVMDAAVRKGLVDKMGVIGGT